MQFFAFQEHIQILCQRQFLRKFKFKKKIPIKEKENQQYPYIYLKVRHYYALKMELANKLYNLSLF